MSKIESMAEFEAWLGTYMNFEKLPQKNMFYLDTIKYLCSLFDNPQDFAPAIHVAGSKGKGSVSMMIASILSKAGYKTGLYTSPHITNFIERVSTPDGAFSNDVYTQSIAEMTKIVSNLKKTQFPSGRLPTWFELATLFAFLCFRRANVERAVYEVGMGGRLDATNVISPSVCAITSIELEHTEYLGNTVEKIAAEKAGIIKRGVPAIVSEKNPSVCAVFESRGKSLGAPVMFLGDIVPDIRFRYNTALHTMHIKFYSPRLFKMPIEADMRLLGEFQARNAALAACVVKTSEPDISEDIIKEGLSTAFLPGRFEIIDFIEKYPHIPFIVFDGAHTVNSIRQTLATFNALFSGQEAEVLFACAADKDVEHIADLLRKSAFVKITVTRPGNIKQADMARAAAAFSSAENCRAVIEDDYQKAIFFALKSADKMSHPLLVTGSFYLLSEVKKLIL